MISEFRVQAAEDEVATCLEKVLRTTSPPKSAGASKVQMTVIVDRGKEAPENLILLD